MVQKKMNPKCGSLAKYTHVFLIVKYYRLTERYCFNNAPKNKAKPNIKTKIESTGEIVSKLKLATMCFYFLGFNFFCDHEFNFLKIQAPIICFTKN